MSCRLLFGVACLFLTLPLFAQSSPPKEDTPVLRQKTQVVTLNVSVVDRENRVITGLKQSDFVLYEDKVKQQIEYFAVNDAPISVGIVFDASASMETKLEKAQEALKAFVQTSHPQDDYFLVAFNREARLLADFTDGEEVVRKVSGIKADGDTALYDAVFLGLEKLKEARHQRRALIVITDGQDNCSRYNLHELSKNIKENDTVIYCFSIAEVQGGNCGQLCQMYSRRALDGLADITGGKAFFPASFADLESATTLIALELRQQYSIGYVPTRTDHDGKWRKISLQVIPNEELRITRRKVIVRTKEGYFAAP